MNTDNTKKYQSRLSIFYAILGLLLVILYSGLFFRQLIESESHAAKEKIQNQRRILTPGPRGYLMDREGRVLVANKSKFSAVVFLSENQVQKAFSDSYRGMVRDYRERGEKINSSIEFQLEKISYSIEKQFDESSKGEIIESGVSLNWAIIKHLNR